MMELRLQQAIVATRAGRTDIAQSLLTQVIRDNPQDANAWFLLGHIVESPERQALYLRKTVELEPDHAMAKKQLQQLQKEVVPAPVLSQQAEPGGQIDAHEETTQLEHPAIAAATVAEMTQRSQPLQSTEIETRPASSPNMTELVGRPVREKRAQSPAPPAVAASSVTTPAAESADEKASSEVWLVRILVLMVIFAAIVLGILVLLILI